jgi:hypothetical protein
MARRARVIGSTAALGLALVLLMRGQLHAGSALLAVALTLWSGGIPGFGGMSQKSAGQTSSVRTRYLEMTLDHDSGAMQGRVIAGQFSGRELADLGRQELIALYRECASGDPQSAAVLEAYLDVTIPGWRDPAEGSGAGPAAATASAMSIEEARMILGVTAAATPDEIHAAWREQMKRNHPDQGGSTFIAARINEAKSVLLGD